MNLLPPGLPSLLVYWSASAEVVRFEAVTPDGLPPGWTVAMTHEGGEPRWRIKRDPNVPRPRFLVAETSQDNAAGRFRTALWFLTALWNGGSDGE